MIHTTPWRAPSGSAIDPLVGEVSWQAWEMVGADPTRLTPETARQVTAGFDGLVEAAWQPGRTIVVSEIEFVLPSLESAFPDMDADETNGSPRLVARLAVGVLGEQGGTAAEAAGLAAHVDTMFRGQQVLAAHRIDPLAVVSGVPATSVSGTNARDVGGHVAHIRQRRWAVGDDHDDVEIVSRFSATFEPWTGVVDHLVAADRHVKVRATVLATELSAADRIEIQHGLSTIAAIRDRNTDSAQLRFETDRAEATLLDLAASLSSPVVAGEVAVWSETPLPESILRSVATCFTSETDVLRRQGHVVVAANRLMLGGFEIVRDPPGANAALAAGLPLNGGCGPRTLADLLTLTESPIGWPLPVRGPLPAVSPRVAVPRPLPPELAGTPTRDAPSLGSDAQGRPVSLPLALRTRHVLVTGTWGAGKSTVLGAQALDDLRAGRGMLFIDPHGTTADQLVAFAAMLGLDPVVIDAADGASWRFSPLPATSFADVEARDRSVRRLAEAVASSLPNVEWAGPRWYAATIALFEAIWVHDAELVDGVVWLNDPIQLREVARHPQLSPAAQSTLVNLTAVTGEGADVRGWVSCKFHPLVGGSVRRIIAPANQGLDLAIAVNAGLPIIVSLASLSHSEANLVGHLILACVLDAAFARPIGERDLYTCYVDEAQRFPVAGLSRAIAEGRKFGIGLMMALQTLSQVSGELADLVLGAGTNIAFRATPETAIRLAPVMQVPAADLISQPDLHATVALQGHPATPVRVPPPERCPEPRDVTPPEPLPPPDNADGDPPGDHTSFMDEFLAKRHARDGDIAAGTTS